MSNFIINCKKNIIIYNFNLQLFIIKKSKKNFFLFSRIKIYIYIYYNTNFLG